MRACGLHAISTLLTSQAALIRPVTPHARSNQSLIKLIVSRIRGVIAASQYVICQYNIFEDNLAEALKITPGRRAATVSPLQDQGWNAVSAMVKKSEIATVMDRLEEVGGTDIFALALDVSSSRMPKRRTPRTDVPLRFNFDRTAEHERRSWLPCSLATYLASTGFWSIYRIIALIGTSAQPDSVTCTLLLDFFCRGQLSPGHFL